MPGGGGARSLSGRAIARSWLHKPLQNDYFAGVLRGEMELEVGDRA